MILKSISELINSKYVKDTFKLVFGSGIGYLATFIALSFVTELYTPEIYGEYAFIITIISSLTLLTQGGLEPGIIRSSSSKDGLILVTICEKILLYSSLICLLIVLVLVLFGRIGYIYFIVPFCIYLVGKIIILKFLFNRKAKYGTLKNNVIINTSSRSFFEILFGYFSLTNFGLYISFIIGNLLSYLHFQNYKSYKKIKIKNSERIRVFNENKELFLFGLPQNLFETVRAILILYLIKVYFDNELLGYYTLSTKLLSLPLALVSVNLGVVYFQRISKDRDNLYSNSIKLLRYLFIFSISLFIICQLIMDTFLRFYLDDSYYDSIVVFFYLLPWFCASMIESAFSNLLIAIRKEYVVFIFSVFYTLVAISIIYYFKADFFLMTKMLGMILTFIFLVYILIIYVILRRYKYTNQF